MTSTELRKVLVIGGAGAQGLSVVHTLSQSGRYSVSVLTRSIESERAKSLAKLPNVTLVQGSQDNQKDLHRAFHGAWGAWINTDGFTIGEKNELFYGIRAYEIARCEGVQHYLYSSVDYPLKDTNWNAKYHWGHNDAKGRVADFIFAQGQQGMTSSIIMTGPYMDMLCDGMFVPQEQEDGSFVWANPALDGKIPLIAVEDMGPNSLWMFDNIKESAGLALKIATDEVSFVDIASTFTQVTGKKAMHRYIPMEEYLPTAEPYPDAPANWAAGPNAVRDESTMTWRENFRAWWMYWGEGRAEKRDWALLDRIHPQRIKSLKEWMEKNNYDGQPKAILKGAEDLRRAVQAQAQAQAKADKSSTFAQIY